MKILLTSLCFLLSITMNAQLLTGIETVWGDSFESWEIYSEDDKGSLESIFSLSGFGPGNSLNRWRYRLGDHEGEIYPKWKDDPSHWEIRVNGGTIITARTKWRDDYREWRISNNSFTIDLKQRWGNDSNEWIAENSYGRIKIKTSWSNDPRSWEITDELEMDVNMKIAILFLAIFNSQF